MANMLNNPNVKAMMAAAAHEDDVRGLPIEVSMEGKLIQEKILHVLSLYPTISMAMLQVGIGTSIPPSIWKPNYEILKAAKIINERRETHESPGGRFIQYMFIELSPLVIPEPPTPKAKEGDDFTPGRITDHSVSSQLVDDDGLDV